MTEEILWTSSSAKVTLAVSMSVTFSSRIR